MADVAGAGGTARGARDPGLAESEERGEGMNITRLVGQWFGLENVDSVDNVSMTFGAPWAQQGPAWLFFGCLVLVIASILFYSRYQRRARVGARTALAIARAILLCLILLILADPVVSVRM